MKFIILTLCLSAFYLQGISGGVVQNVELTIEKMTENLEKELNDLVEPITTGAKKIEDRFIAYQIRQSEIETFSLWNLNYSACMEFGSTLENSTHLAYNISTTAYEIVMNVSNSFNALSSHCFSWNPYEAVKCYISNIATIKDEIESIKPLIKLYENIVLKLSMKVEDQFYTCVGDKPTTVPTTKPTEAPTAKPTEAPTAKPTEAPTAKPTEAPTAKPTETPTAKPTEAPTAKPVVTSTNKPTEASTAKPTTLPASQPTKPPTTSSTPALVTTTKKHWW